MLHRHIYPFQANYLGCGSFGDGIVSPINRHPALAPVTRGTSTVLPGAWSLRGLQRPPLARSQGTFDDVIQFSCGNRANQISGFAELKLDYIVKCRGASTSVPDYCMSHD